MLLTGDPVVEGKGRAKKRVRGVAKLFLSRSHLLTLFVL